MTIEISDSKIVLKMTPHMIAKMIKMGTGVDVSSDTHWFKATFEQTTQSPPYSLVTLEAIKHGSKS